MLSLQSTLWVLLKAKGSNNWFHGTLSLQSQGSKLDGKLSQWRVIKWHCVRTINFVYHFDFGAIKTVPVHRNLLIYCPMYQNRTVCDILACCHFQGFITMEEQGSEGSLQIASLPQDFRLDTKWPCRRMPPEMLPAGSTTSNLIYVTEYDCYCCSTSRTVRTLACISIPVSGKKNRPLLART